MRFCRLLTSNLATIFVGRKRKAFHLHLDLLCDRSTYFKAAFLGNFKEAGTRELFLPDDNDSAFELFVNWLYGASLSGPSKNEEVPGYLALLALSEKFMLEYLGNQCMDLIRGYYSKSAATVQANDISYVFENTEGLAVRGLLVDLAAVQTLETKINGFLPGFRELMAGGGAFAADFSWCLIYHAKSKKRQTSIKSVVGRQTSCLFHTHDFTPKCKGPSFHHLASTLELERLWQVHTS